MDTNSLIVGYRPVRFGWCLRKDDINAFRRAVQLTHILWGGKYNPIIPVDDTELAKYLVEFFRVDALYPMTKDESIKNFVGRFRHLPWPSIHENFFIDGSREKMVTFLDVYHPIRKIYETEVQRVANPAIRVCYYKWDPNDPLRDVFLVMFGTYVANEDILIDYNEFLKRLPVTEIHLRQQEPVPADSDDDLTLNSITTHGLSSGIRDAMSDYDGFYVGRVGEFDDLVNLWNLRAAALKILFYDPDYANRFELQKDSFLKRLRARPERFPNWPNRIYAWSATGNESDLSFLGKDFTRSYVSIHSWNGFNIPQRRIVARSTSVIGATSESYDASFTTFQLPEKPFYDDRYFPDNEHAVITIQVISSSTRRAETFRVPYLPELNEFYGRNLISNWSSARAEPGALGIIDITARDQITLRSIKNQILIKEMFHAYGFEATASKPGFIAQRIIDQMGGLQGCRVFKIPGVRKLLESHSYLQHFHRGTALQTIRQKDPSTRKFTFDKFKDLYIERRQGGDLQPEDVLKHLVCNGVLRVGLNLACPNCQLDTWVSIDDIGTMVVCEYCGKDFNVTRQLRDRSWAYRKSGIFGKDDNQEGGISVVVTLQQLDTLLSLHWSVYSTGTELKSPVIPNVDHKCELDFVLLTESYGGKPQLVLGECKTNRQIDEEHVNNLKAIADHLPSQRVETFLLFGKLAPFTSEEVELCRRAQGEHRWRVIMLSDRELEPYFVYEWAREEFEIDSTAVSLDDLAKVTHQLYFDPKPKKK